MKYILVFNQSAEVQEFVNTRMMERGFYDFCHATKATGTYSIFKAITTRSKHTEFVSVGKLGYDPTSPIKSVKGFTQTHEEVDTARLDYYASLQQACLWLAMQEGVSLGNCYMDGSYFTIGAQSIRVKDHQAISRGWECSHQVILEGVDSDEDNLTRTTSEGLLDVVKRVYGEAVLAAKEYNTFNPSAESNFKYLIRNLLAIAARRNPKALDKPKFVLR